MPEQRISREKAIRRIRSEIELLGKPRSRRSYASEWGVPPSTVYYWIKEAEAQAEDALEELDEVEGAR